jgi:hypothetical protein
MKAEFDKIISSIFTCVLFTVAFRFVYYMMVHWKENELTFPDENYKDKKGWIGLSVCVGVMLLLNVFFFVYCVVFCGVYVNTQYGWFYSGLWSLFFIWGVFSFVYIVIISLIQYLGQQNTKIQKVVNYMKELFIF